MRDSKGQEHIGKLIAKEQIKPDISFAELFMQINFFIFLFAINNMYGKEIMNLDIGKVTFIEFTLFRSSFMMVGSYLLLYGDRRSVTDVEKKYRWILTSRALVGTFVFLITTVALKMLPLSIYVMILNTVPFMTAIV